MSRFRHRIGVRAEIYFDLDLPTATPSQSQLVRAIAARLSEAADEEGALRLDALAGGRVFPAWNSVDRDLEPEEALLPEMVQLRDTVAVEWTV